MQELEGKVALVVGAGSIAEGLGNGRATAIMFAREGANVVCADINEAAAAETVKLIQAEGLDATAAEIDVADLDSVKHVVARVLADHGRIDVLDNNVGIASLGGVVDLDPESWDRAMRINLTGAVYTMREVIPHMSEAGGGSIVNISSVAGIRWGGIPHAAYYASKAALNHLTRTTAVEFAAKNVRVNAVLPGLIKTPMVAHADGVKDAYASVDMDEVWRARDRLVPMGHMGEAWDVANAALFLASDRAKYVTGAEIIVDGGISVVGMRI